MLKCKYGVSFLPSVPGLPSLAPMPNAVSMPMPMPMPNGTWGFVLFSKCHTNRYVCDANTMAIRDWIMQSGFKTLRKFWVCVFPCRAIRFSRFFHKLFIQLPEIKHCWRNGLHVLRQEHQSCRDHVLQQQKTNNTSSISVNSKRIPTTVESQSRQST